MKNKLIGCFIVIMIVSIFVISCVTDTGNAAPQATLIEAAAAAVPLGEDPAALNAAAERAAKARQLAEDFHAPGYCPAEWESADALYSQAESSKSIAGYNAAAEALEAVAEKAIDQFADDQEAELFNARDRAVQAGAEELAWDYLFEADNKTLEILIPYEAKEYYAARDALFLARDMYESIEIGLNAYHLRLDLEDRGFARYDPPALDAIDETGLSAIDDYEAGDIKTARGKAEDVLEQYHEYQSKWMKSYVTDAADNAAGERQRALDIKANIAVRFDFDTADVLYTRAQDALNDENYEGAANLFDRSRSLFAAASRLTLEKRDLAEEALVEADSRMIESDETAQRAETILEGGI